MIKRIVSASADIVGKQVYIMHRESEDDPIYERHLGTEVSGRTASTIFIRNPAGQWPYYPAMMTARVEDVLSETPKRVVLRLGGQ